MNVLLCMSVALVAGSSQESVGMFQVARKVGFDEPIAPTWVAYGNATPSRPLVSANFVVSGYDCDMGEDLAWVMRPDDDGRYPVLSWLHGLGSGGDMFKNKNKRGLSYLASLGFVVVATKSGAGSNRGQDKYCGTSHLDQLRALEWALEAPELQAHVDRDSGTGLIGFSCGAWSTLAAASMEQALSLNVKIAVAIHPHAHWAFDQSQIVPLVPVMVLTGDVDVKHRQLAFDLQAHVRAPEQLLVEVKGAMHNDMVTAGKQYEAPCIEHYLACKMKHEMKSCALVEGCGNPIPGVNIAKCQYATNKGQ